MAPVAATTEFSTTATATPEVQGVSAGVSTRRGRQGWCSSTDDADKHQSTGSFSQPPPPLDDLVPTTPLVSLPPGFQMPTAHSLASAHSTARCVFVWTTLSRSDQEDGNDWVRSWRTQLTCSASRHATLVSHLYAGREPAPEFLEQPHRRRSSPGTLVLAHGKDPSALAAHLNGPWHIICLQESAGFVTGSSFAKNVHVATHHCAVPLNFCARLHVHVDPRPMLAQVFLVNL